MKLEVIRLDDLTYLLIGYMVIWLGLFLYVLYLHFKQNKVSQDVELLEEMVRTYEKRDQRKGKKGKARK